MHQTTVRFGSDLWEALEMECGRLGVSAAQYVREAALARLMYGAGRRIDEDYEHALVAAGAVVERAPAQMGDVVAARARMRESSEETEEQRQDAMALHAQSSLVVQRARAIRRPSRELRGLPEEGR
jgi:hypothetical protein